MSIYFLETERLGFRLLQQTDSQYLLGLETDPEVQQFSAKGMKTPAQITAMIDACLTEYAVNKLPFFCLFNLASNEFMGCAGFFIWKTGDIEVGYSLHKKFWQQGYATEALKALLAWGRDHIAVDYIGAGAVVKNLASIRVMEKCGMKYYQTSIDDGVEYYCCRIKNR